MIVAYTGLCINASHLCYRYRDNIAYEAIDRTVDHDGLQADAETSPNR